MKWIAICVSFIVIIAKGQTVQKLVYPGVPLKDSCFFAFDDTTNVSIWSKEKLQKQKGVWASYNYCFDYAEDTVYASSFILHFYDPIKNSTHDYLINDGNLKNEHQMSSSQSLNTVKPYTQVTFKDIQFKREGAVHQISDKKISIDSFVIPEMDLCWQYFSLHPKKNNERQRITHKKLINLIHEFGYNSCTQKQENIPDNVKVSVELIPVDKSTLLPEFISKRGGVYQLQKDESKENISNGVLNLKIGDVVIFNRISYEKDGEYVFSQRYDFVLVDSVACKTTFTLDTLGSQNGLPEQIQSQWNDKNDAPICLIDNMGNRVSFVLVLAPQNGSTSMYSSTGGWLSKRMMREILSLKKGDAILIERLDGTDPYDQTRKRYPAVNFKLE